MGTLLTIEDSANITQHVFNMLASRLAPCVEQLKPRIFPDGNKWCCLYGENIQDGIVGFGDTPIQAVGDFEKNFYSQTLTNKQN